MDLETLLFHEPLAAGGRPLFKSQVDLASAVKEVPGGSFKRADKKVESVRAFVNQVLNTRRPMSPNLREAILAAAKQRTKDQENWPALLHEFDTAIAALEQQRRARNEPLDDALEFDALEAASETAHVHFIITDSPAEVTSSEKATRLRRQLVTNLQLAVRGSESDLSEAAHYLFHFPDRSLGIQFWRQLEAFLVDYLKKPRSDIERRLRRVEESGHLHVYELAPSFLSVFPSVVFDPESDDRRSGFIFYYHDEGRVSVATMPPDVMQKWKDQIYLKISAAQPPFQRTRIRYQDYVAIRNQED